MALILECRRKTLLWWEEKKSERGGDGTRGRRGFIGIGARPAVISGQVVVVGRNRLQRSGGATFSFTCKPNINHGHRLQILP